MISTFLSESVPGKHRAKFIVIVYSLFFCLGELYAITIGYLTLDDLDNGNWRLTERLLPITMIVSLFLTTFFLQETPRYQILLGDFNRGFTRC